MKIEINYQPSTEHYIWKLYTGADGVDEYEGVAISIGESQSVNVLRRLSSGKS